MHRGSMSSGELAVFIEREFPSVHVVSSDRHRFGLYVGDDHVGGWIGQSLPVRSILDPQMILVTRGWLDVLAGIAQYSPGNMHSRLAHFMGQKAYRIAYQNHGLPVEGDGDTIPAVGRSDVSQGEWPEWAGKRPGEAA